MVRNCGAVIRFAVAWWSYEHHSMISWAAGILNRTRPGI
jgi:hypothetical protein